MKKSGRCPKCNSDRVGHLENVIQRSEVLLNSQPLINHCPAPLGIERTESEGFIKVIKEGPVGRLEAYLCTDCGYYETYVIEPNTVSFDSIVGFEWVNSAAS